MNTNRRGWVKNAIIIFLIIMLILTFFSNTIMNYSLPEVAAQYSQSGSITSKIRTSATVKANSTHKIVIDETRKILSVAVKDGDDVKIGDVLFYLEDAESNELKTARETLASLEKQYKLKQLESGVDYFNDELAIKNKRDELEKAQKAMDKVDVTDPDAAEAEVKRLEAEQKNLAKLIEAYNKQISALSSKAADASIDGTSTADRITAASAKLDAVKAVYEQALSKKEATEAALENAEKILEQAKAAQESAGAGSSTEAEIKKNIEELERKMRYAKEDREKQFKEWDNDLQTAYDLWVDADFRYNSALALYNQGSGSYDAVERWRTKAEQYHEEYDTKAADINKKKSDYDYNYNRTLEENQRQLDDLNAQLGNAGLVTRVKNAENNKNAAATAAESAKTEFTKRETEYNEAKTDYDKLVCLQKLEECESAVGKLNDQNEDLKAEIDALKNYDDQTDKIKTLKQDLETLVHNLAKKKEENALQNAKDQLDMNELVEKIEEQQALVKKYEANSVDAKIVADIDGQVGSLSATAGSETTMGQTLCEIVVTDLGYSCEINLNAEQAKRVRTGDEVTITNNWWSNIKGTIASVRNDPKNPGQNKIATITLTGDVTVNQSLSITIGEKGQTYDSVVPNSAVREDNNGKFVLAVEAKSSPLGNRYVAKRVDVNVLASDDTNSAVSGVAGGEFIITTSTKPISAGMQVRMAENSK